MPPINTQITIVYYAYDTAAQDYIAGDEANHTLVGSADGVEFTPAAAPAQIGATDQYSIVVAAGENTGVIMNLGGSSSTANVLIMPEQWEGVDYTTIADAILSRAVSNVEATAPAGTLARLLLAAFHSEILPGGTWEIRETDDVTVVDTPTVTLDGSAAPMTQVVS